MPFWNRGPTGLELGSSLKAALVLENRCVADACVPLRPLSQNKYRVRVFMLMKEQQCGSPGAKCCCYSYLFQVVCIVASTPQIYKNTLQTQLLESAGERHSSVKFGASLSEEKLKHFQDEQIGQLYELMLESTKPNRQFDIREDSK